VRADVVIPFRGRADELRRVVERARAVHLGPGDRLIVVDNRPGGPPLHDPAVLRAPERQSSYHARNRGAGAGTAPWIVFLDGDVSPAPDLLDRYLEPAPADDVGVLAGRIADQPAGPGDPLALRYAAAHGLMDDAITLGDGRWAYAQTANCAVRREAFAAVGGFVETIRSGGDADLCFRLRDAGWRLEARPDAEVVHHNRTSLLGLARQVGRHGAGAAWLDRRYPGSFPRALGPGTLAHSARTLARAARTRDALALVELYAHWAFELGRLLPNGT
jgi:glycosyl transferase family 2